MNLLVVGASSDMGMTLIRSVADRYECIVAHYRTMSEPFGALCEQFKGKLYAIQADLNDREAIRSMIEAIYEKSLIPDHIVHLAAQKCCNGHFHKTPLDVYDMDMQIGYFSLCQIAHAFLKDMSKKSYGKLVVMLSDVLRDAPPAYCSQYITTKYAMLGFMLALSAEYSSKNICVNAVSPGWTQTKYIENQPNLLVEKYVQQSPHKCLLLPEEVTDVIAMLLMPQADHISGQNIFING
ncbi:MAG: SDR family oxidoreductase [Clostridia bacterium]